MKEQVFCGITPGHPPHDLIEDRVCGGYPPSGYSQNPVMVNRRSSNQDGSNICLAHWIWCPGCVTAHRPQSRLPETQPDFSGPLWDWDGNIDSPTFSPSYLSWWTSGPEHTDHRCHSFIRNGVWEFLDDCTHSLAGKKIPMVPVPDWLVRREGA